MAQREYPFVGPSLCWCCCVDFLDIHNGANANGLGRGKQRHQHLPAQCGQSVGHAIGGAPDIVHGKGIQKEILACQLGLIHRAELVKANVGCKHVDIPAKMQEIPQGDPPEQRLGHDGLGG